MAWQVVEWLQAERRRRRDSRKTCGSGSVWGKTKLGVKDRLGPAAER